VKVADITFYLTAERDINDRPRVYIDDDFRNNPRILIYEEKGYSTVAAAKKGIERVMREICKEFARHLKREKKA